MSETYNPITAYHYAAYRPPLHGQILAKCLQADQRFELGLDIGCGVGHSSLALSQYCNQVIGLEPSQAMLDQAIPQAKVSYRKWDNSQVSSNYANVDIVTFAGSLFYAQSDPQLARLFQSLRPESQILVYDFAVNLESVIPRSGQLDSTYNHQANFSGLSFESQLTQTCSNSEVVQFQITNSELTHLLLSDTDVYLAMEAQLGPTNLEAYVKNTLGSIENSTRSLNATIYYTVYQVS